MLVGAASAVVVLGPDPVVVVPEAAVVVVAEAAGVVVAEAAGVVVAVPEAAPVAPADDGEVVPASVVVHPASRTRAAAAVARAVFMAFRVPWRTGCDQIVRT